MLEELEGEPAEPVPVGNHNLLDISPHGPVQNGKKAGSLPVDARGDVLDDFVFGMRGLEGLDLPGEVALLLAARDPRVADSGPRLLSDAGRFLGPPCEDLPEVIGAVEPLTGRPDPDGAYSAEVRVLAERVVADAEALPHGGAGEEPVGSIHKLQLW